MQRKTSACRIGALAAVAGVTVDTLRYYEREGLLPRPRRSAGGFRLYGPKNAQRVRFIRQARQLGLSLREIRQLLEPENTRCSTVRDVIAERLSDVDHRVRELATFRLTLLNALERCEQALGRSKYAICPVARQLGTEKSSHIRTGSETKRHRR